MRFIPCMVRGAPSIPGAIPIHPRFKDHVLCVFVIEAIGSRRRRRREEMGERRGTGREEQLETEPNGSSRILPAVLGPLLRMIISIVLIIAILSMGWSFSNTLNKSFIWRKLRCGTKFCLAV